MESSIWGGIVGLLGLLLGGGGLAAIITSRSQARKTDADAQAVEAKVGPEVDSIAVNALNVTTTALQAENARLVERLNQTLDTVEKQSRTIAEQSDVIDRQADTIAEYHSQVQQLTAEVESLKRDLANLEARLRVLLDRGPSA